MQIVEAINYTRAHIMRLRDVGEHHVRENANSIASKLAFQDAEAIETVCDALEAFLQKREEDNSYHSG